MFTFCFNRAKGPFLISNAVSIRILAFTSCSYIEAEYQPVVASNVRLVGLKMVRRFGSLLLGVGFVLAVSAGSASAHFQVLYRFKDAGDGGSASALIMDKIGNFYGTTPSGGSANKGTVFKLAPDGTKTTLYDFNDADSGAVPRASLLRDGAGNLYGTTANTSAAGDKGGTVFKLWPDGHETVLHRFTTTDPAGYFPLAELIADKSGNLCSTTAFGNGICDCGTVFKLAPDGTITILHAFTGGSDGSHPEAGLVADKNGNLYGTTMNEGAYGSGTVFRIGADGTKTTLHSFNITTDGADPLGSLIIGKDGNLYGTTFDGGPEWTAMAVSVFKMTPSTELKRFSTISAWGSATVKIRWVRWSRTGKAICTARPRRMAG